jgi:ABC-type sugar transport system ATPase subunit
MNPPQGFLRVKSNALFSALRTTVATWQTVLFVTHSLDEVAALCDTVTVLRAGTMVGVQRAMPMSQAEMIEAMFWYPSRQMYTCHSVRETNRPARWMLNDVSFHEHMLDVGPLDYTIPSGAIIGLAGLEAIRSTAILPELPSGLRQPAQGVVHYDDAPFAV